MKRIGDVMVSVFTSSAVDMLFKPKTIKLILAVSPLSTHL